MFLRERQRQASIPGLMNSGTKALSAPICKNSSRETQTQTQVWPEASVDSGLTCIESTRLSGASASSGASTREDSAAGLPDAV